LSIEFLTEQLLDWIAQSLENSKSRLFVLLSVNTGLISLKPMNSRAAILNFLVIGVSSLEAALSKYQCFKAATKQ
jgi:hypothetical protein